MTEETKQLTLMDQFKLFLWVYWKSRLMEDNEVASVLDFVSKMDDNMTVTACLDELEKLRLEYNPPVQPDEEKGKGLE